MAAINLAGRLVQHDKPFQSRRSDCGQEGSRRGQLNIFPPQPTSDVKWTNPGMIS
jgi:hypothetical protein